MPNISAHMVIAKEVSRKLNVNSDDFIRGNLLPDIIDIEDSHYKIKNGVYLVSNIKRFLDLQDLSNNLYIGYLTHLLLDKHYLEDYLGKMFYNKNVFLDVKIYNYYYLNHRLINKFDLNIKLI